MEDEALGNVELDEVVGGEGGSEEGGDEDLDYHDDEEEHADGGLRGGYSRALGVGFLGAVDIAWAFDRVQGEVHHGRE